MRAMLVAEHVHSNAEFVECRCGCLRGDVAQELNVIACGKRSENAEKLPKVRESQNTVAQAMEINVCERSCRMISRCLARIKSRCEEGGAL